MTIKILTATAIFAASLLGSLTTAPIVAFANDNELFCFEYTLNGQEELECDTIGNLKAECKLTDPDTTTGHCKHVTSQFRTKVNKLKLGR